MKLSLDLKRDLLNYLIIYNVSNIVTFTQQHALWATLPHLTKGTLLQPELLAIPTCLSIPNFLVVDHKVAKDSPVQEGVICNNVPHFVLIRFVID